VPPVTTLLLVIALALACFGLAVPKYFTPAVGLAVVLAIVALLIGVLR
jgi:hypothetical protein